MLTDNVNIKEELLKIAPAKMSWQEVRRVGREAQGRIFSKEVREDKTVAKVGADSDKKIKCFHCNGRHLLRECQADKSKMSCSDCGNTADFKSEPHWKGA